MNIFATEQTEELQREAWAALRIHDLHDNPKQLATAIEDLLGGAAPLESMLKMLTSTEPRLETALDRVVHQHDLAMKLIDVWVELVVTAEEKRGDWRHFDE